MEGIIPEKYEIEGSGSTFVSIDSTSEGITLRALAPGTAYLALESNGKKIKLPVVVHPRETQEMPRTKPSERPKISGVKTSTIGSMNIIQGEITSRADYQRLLILLRDNPKNLVVTAKVSPSVKESLLEQARNLLRSKKINNIEVSNMANRFLLEGYASSPEELEFALENVRSIIPNIENQVPIPIRIDPTISMRVFIVELSKHAHEQLGLSWPSSTNSIFQFSLDDAKGFSFGGTWAATLQHLSQSGQAKVLAEPVLWVKNGASAHLSAGGEIPIRVIGRLENSVTWRHYGLKIQLHINGIAGNKIRTKIETESSHLDEATAVDGLPGIRSNKMSTEVDATANVPILLTGVFQSTRAKDIEKVPVLSNIPILGELFKSRRFREHQSELLIALLPSFGAEKLRIRPKRNWKHRFLKNYADTN
ncbi:MAG: hypothetical protein AB7F43_12010 [Bacteriovoracia bacterium]